MGYRVAAFYPDWSVYRPELGQYSYEKMGPCTEAIYSFAVMNPETYEIQPADPEAAKDQYPGFVSFCVKTGKKPVLALGGWVDSCGDKYSRMLTDESNRQAFIISVVEHLKTNGFQGINLDIEYPTCPQHDLKNGNLNDKEGFSNLIKEMKAALQSHGLELSACLPGSTSVIDRAFDISSLNEHLDWIGVMTYDYNVSSGSKTGPISSLADSKNTLNYLIQKGAIPEKLVVGIPFYGHRYHLMTDEEPHYGIKSVRGPPGKYTEEVLTNYEIHDLIRNKGYLHKKDKDGSFAYREKDFISFNSEHDILQKLELAKELKLGGVMIWEVSMDDFTGQFCNKGINPFMNLINENLKA